MDNYYSFLGIDKNASPLELKKAFRERAKTLHPDIAGKNTENQMRRLITAYQTLSNPDRRYAYDRAYIRFSNVFDYPTFLRERKTDPASQAKLIFFLLLHPNNEQYDPLDIWIEYGGLSFPLDKYLDREDWMDCAFLLAEELDRQGQVFEAFSLLLSISKEEKRQPYFKHFMEDVHAFIMEIALHKLKSAIDTEPYINCLEMLLALGFSPKEEIRILRSLADLHVRLGERGQAELLRREIAGRKGIKEL